MLLVQKLPDKSLGTMTEPCCICGSRTAPRVVDAGLTVCESRVMCFRRRYGVIPREEPYSLSDLDHIRYGGPA